MVDLSEDWPNKLADYQLYLAKNGQCGYAWVIQNGDSGALKVCHEPLRHKPEPHKDGEAELRSVPDGEC